MATNFLCFANYIKNSDLCAHDVLDGYASNFQINGNVDGWDLYDNTYLYGCWGGYLFGTSYDRSCYVSRSNVFTAVSAETHYIVKITMKITSNSGKSVPTTGRVQWVTLSDVLWNSDKQYDFDVIADNKFHIYEVNMGPAQWWQGDINNLRIYPFIDGWGTDHFVIKSIKVTSLNVYACSNTQCSYYSYYEHPCAGRGLRASCESGIEKDSYTTVSGVNDELIINIGSYGNEYFSLGSNTNLNGAEIARVISGQLSTLDIGSYVYAVVEHTTFNRLKIYSGSFGSSSIRIEYSPAAVELGFYNSEEEDIAVYESGSTPADGFDYASSNRLNGYEINSLFNGKKDETAYGYTAGHYNVEAGRYDFSVAAADGSDLLYTFKLPNDNKTVIDVTHPINDSGKIKNIRVVGSTPTETTPKVKIFRPRKNGYLETLYTISFPSLIGGALYTNQKAVVNIDCDVLVDKGDLIGFYNFDLYYGKGISSDIEALYYQVDGEASGIFETGEIYGKGLSGLSFYARSDRRQKNILLDIDLGHRSNISDVKIYGSEESTYFEYNIAPCLDVDWSVNLFSETHKHSVCNENTGTCYTYSHNNIAYGEECLSDTIRTADNGLAGTSYGSDSSGIWTSGDHSYFYVNGDAEWASLEYTFPMAIRGTYDYERDPIEFTFTFPFGFTQSIYKIGLYFKERYNFKNLRLSYYLGTRDGSGDDLSSDHRLVPSYTAVSLDDLRYDSSNNENIKEYLFKNPMVSDPIISDGVCINSDLQLIVASTNWLSLVYEFDDVICYGFKIRCDYHKSTKLTELEIYGRVELEPSFIDNVTLRYSSYGDVWNSATFLSCNDDVIMAHVGSYPRYVTLEFDTYEPFVLNEIEFLIGDEVKLSNCDDRVLLDDCKINSINDSTFFSVENVYDAPLTLSVDIFKDPYEESNIIFWNKLNSLNSLLNSEIGPGAVLHKHADFTITNANTQCAINGTCYGLKNLIDGKTAYTMGDSQTWEACGELSDGVEINFTNTPYSRVTEFTIDEPVSSKYWKIVNSWDEGASWVYYRDSRDFKNIQNATPSPSNRRFAYDDYEDDWVYTTNHYGGGYATATHVSTGFYDMDSSAYYAKTDFSDIYVNTEGDSPPNVITGFLPGYYIVWLRLNGQREEDYIWVTIGSEAPVSVSLSESVPDDWEWKRVGNSQFYIDSNTQFTFRFDRNHGGYYWDLLAIRGIAITTINAPPSFEVTGNGGDVFVDDVATYFGDPLVHSFIDDLYVFNDGEPAEIENVYMKSTPDYGSQVIQVEHDNGKNLRRNVIIEDDFEDGVLDPKWTIVNPEYGSFVEAGGELLANADTYYSIYSGGYWRCYTPTLLANATTFSGGVSDYYLEFEHAFYYIPDGNNKRVYCYVYMYYDDTYISQARIYTQQGNHKWVYYSDKDGASYNPAAETVDEYNSILSTNMQYHRIGDKVYILRDNKLLHVVENATTDVINKVMVRFYCDVEDNITPSALRYFFFGEKPFFSDGYNIGFSLKNSDPVDRIKFRHSLYHEDFMKMSVAVSPDNNDNYLILGDFINDALVPPITFIYSNDTYYDYLAINLQYRHDLDIIRNYGQKFLIPHSLLDDAISLPFLSTVALTEYSNTVTTDVDEVVWGNSDCSDAMWVRILVLCGDVRMRLVPKIGIYPTLSTAYCIGGGYNCEWEDLGTMLTDYSIKNNIIYNSQNIVVSSYFSNFYDFNAVDGNVSSTVMEECWGSEGETNPTFTVMFDEASISEIILYHGYSEEDGDYMNTDYFIDVDFEGVSHWNQNDKHDLVELTNNDLTATILYAGDVYIHPAVRCALGVSSGKWYWEIYVDYCASQTSAFSVGVGNISTPLDTRFGMDEYGWCYRHSGSFYHDGTSISTGVYSYDTGDIVCIALDADEGKVWFAKNNSWQLGQDPGSNIGAIYTNLVGILYPIVSGRSSMQGDIKNIISTFRVDESEFSYPIPDGFKAYSGNFSNVVQVTSNIEFNVKHVFDPPVLCSGIMLTVTNFDSPNIRMYDYKNEEWGTFNGALLREVEVYSAGSSDYSISSEEWPVVCVNLKDKFNILGHSLVNATSSTFDDWDNSEEFFEYSDYVTDEPKKVLFNRVGQDVVVYSSTKDSGDYAGHSEYWFDDNVYLEQGVYNVTWQSYDSDEEGEISLRIINGQHTIDSFSDVNSGWGTVNDVVTIPEAGFYSIYGVQHIYYADSWGIKNPVIFRTSGLTKWVAIKRDTATNYSYNGSLNGVDYLNRLLVYGDTRYIPTENSWWWQSNNSVLDNDSIHVKVGKRSLKITPTISGVDTVFFREGDTFGIDGYWSEKDVLTFWLYIDDVTMLYTSYGDVSFGDMYSEEPTYYTWNLDNLVLTTGENIIKLKFEDYDLVEPYEQFGVSSLLSFRTSETVLKSFRFRYKSLGPLNMYIDDIKIQRNCFEDDVRFSKGLCLTGHEYLDIPLSTVDLDKGTIEFWCKPYYDSRGVDMFNSIGGRTFFTITNSNNDILGLVIKSGSWFEIVTGNLRNGLNLISPEVPSTMPYFNINTVFHIGFVWDVNRTIESKYTTALYINNYIIIGDTTTWSLGSVKGLNVRLGGPGPHNSYGIGFYGSSVFENIRVYNYCKTEFNLNEESIIKDISYNSSDFIEISKNNIDFYDKNSTNTPLVFEGVASGEKKVVYVRTIKDSTFKNTLSKDANLIVQWVTTC